MRMTGPTSMRAHLHFTAFLFVLIGAVFALAAVLAPSLFSATAQAMAESGEEGADVGAALIAWTGRTVAVGGAVLSLPSLVCGWGLLRRRAWSRWLGIFLAALAVVQIPVGTIMGGYILWVLLSARFEAWFEPAERDGAL
jgi:hypothetical protein